MRHEHLDPRNGLTACSSHDVAFDTSLLTGGPALQLHVSGGPRRRSPRTAETPLAEDVRAFPDATGGPEVRGVALVAAAVGGTVPRIAEIADVTEADVEEWLARYRDYEASFTGYPD